VLIGHDDIDWKPNSMAFFPTPSANDWFVMIPLITGAFIFQFSLFTVWNNLVRPRTTKRVNTLMTTSGSMCALLYVCVGVLGSLMYGSENSNFIVDLPHTVFYEILRLLYGFALVAHFAVIHYVFRSSVDENFFPNTQFNWIRHTVITMFGCGLTTVFGTLVPDLASIRSLTTALLMIPLNIILPLIFYVKLHYNRIEGKLQTVTMLKESSCSVPKKLMVNNLMLNLGTESSVRIHDESISFTKYATIDDEQARSQAEESKLVRISIIVIIACSLISLIGVYFSLDRIVNTCQEDDLCA